MCHRDPIEVKKLRLKIDEMEKKLEEAADLRKADEAKWLATKSYLEGRLRRSERRLREEFERTRMLYGYGSGEANRAFDLLLRVEHILGYETWCDRSCCRKEDLPTERCIQDEFEHNDHSLALEVRQLVSDLMNGNGQERADLLALSMRGDADVSS